LVPLETTRGVEGRTVTIDLTRVRFIDSTGIRLLTSAVERIRAAAAVCASSSRKRTSSASFEVVGVHDMLPFADAT